MHIMYVYDLCMLIYAFEVIIGKESEKEQTEYKTVYQRHGIFQAQISNLQNNFIKHC